MALHPAGRVLRNLTALATDDNVIDDDVMIAGFGNRLKPDSVHPFKIKCKPVRSVRRAAFAEIKPVAVDTLELIISGGFPVLPPALGQPIRRALFSQPARDFPAGAPDEFIK